MVSWYRLACLLFFAVYRAHASRVLLLSAPVTSHLLEQRDLGLSLAARGHEVWMALETGYPQSELVAPPPLRVINYRIPDGAARRTSVGVADCVLSMTKAERRERWPKLTKYIQNNCWHIMSDADFLRRLDQLQFDIVVVDSLRLDLCYLIVPHHMRVPFVDFYSWPNQWDARVPLFPSVVPHALTRYSEIMTFWERLSNLMTYVSMELSDHTNVPTNMSLLRQYAPQYRSWSELRRKAALFISTTDYFLGIRQPSLPNTLHVSPFSAKPARPLPAYIDNIVSTAPDDGVILMSLGSLIGNIPPTLFNKLIDAFRQLPYTILLKYKTWENITLPENVPKNVHLLSWIPQNDIIGHPRTVLFVTHCGNGGLHEAVYHGVPMVALPVFAEQPQNAARIVQVGFGLSLDIDRFTASELVSAIKEVLHNASYRAAIGKASAILRDRPMNGLETVTFWVEHVMKFGAAHLRSHGQDMAAYEFFMLDIMAFLLLLLVVTILVVWKSTQLICGFITGGIQCKKKTQ